MEKNIVFILELYRKGGMLRILSICYTFPLNGNLENSKSKILEKKKHLDLK